MGVALTLNPHHNTCKLIIDTAVSTESYTRQHRRNRSDASVISSLSYTGSDVVSSEDVAEVTNELGHERG